MKQITPDDVDNVILTLPENQNDHLDYLLNLLESEQPFIYDFLHNDYALNEDELELLLYISLIAWYIIRDMLKRNEQISEDYLFEQYDPNFVDYQDDIYNNNKSDSEINKSISYPNNQPVLMSYMVLLISKIIDEPGCRVRHEMIPEILTDAKTVIDCLVIDEDKALAEICDKEFSDKSFKSVSESVEGYTDDFKKSSYFMKLNNTEKDEAQHIIRNFSEMMYNYFLMIPANWNARRAVMCLSEIMPSKVVADNSYFEAVEPVMTAFLTFCGDKGYVTDGKIIARRLLGISESIIEESNNEENWSPGKQLIKEAEREGIDISDKNQIESFINEYNKDKVSLFQSGAAKANPDKPGRNDPCPCGSGKKYKKCCGVGE
ncbi:MAG TPA: SEC-C metal-binding domain-containing protein [Spirochaetota bacterium]|nr:SEC-C metal-binding domain-containing protein [Spirochaetota bacterium]